MKSTFLTSAALAAFVLGSGGAASAAPSNPTIIAQYYAPPPPAPFIGSHHVDGRIVESRPFFIAVRVGPQVIPVHLHQGTVILPTGTTLIAGMLVGIDGNWGPYGGFNAYNIYLR